MNHTFDVDLAEIHGLEAAILIHHFQYWIRHNRKLKRNFRDGRTWTFQTIAEICAHFPYWTYKQTRRILDHLVDKKILVKGNFNKTEFDRTVWYAFVNESDFLNKLYDCPNGQMEKPKRANGFGETGTPIPDPKPDAKQDPLPPTPSESNVEIVPTKEESEEFFRILKNRNPDSPKIKCMKSWRKAVLRQIRETRLQKEKENTISECHKAQVAEFDGRRINGDLVSVLNDRVEFTSGGFCRAVYYNIPDSDWIEQTKIWFTHGNT